MKSLKYLYRIGNGPSSSHTIGPYNASIMVKDLYPTADCFKVVLYGSLAKTGKGHMTDLAIKEALGEKAEIVFDLESATEHPNTMDFFVYKQENLIESLRIFSVGGGEIQIAGQPLTTHEEIYDLNSFTEIANYCEEKNIRIYEYVEQCEGKEIWDYLKTVWQVMKKSIDDGLKSKGTLPGGLNVQKKARFLYRQTHLDESEETKNNRLICAFAYAVSEQNASLGKIVTAPTCGASGVLPAVLKYLQVKRNFTDDDIVKALATAGVIGNLIKTNASISGAECGCQAEIGTACAMAAAGAAELYGLNLDEIEYSAEMCIEHHLGLTCDPVLGLVQIPCIERNAVAAMRSLNAVNLADFLADSRKISFDMIVKTMYETGKDLKVIYRETSEGGIAKNYM